jgi:hypothetical protein
MNSTDSTPAKVLVLHGDLAVTRLVRETLQAFFLCEVESAAVALGAYERALQSDWTLFIFDLESPVLSGPLLYDLLARAYQFAAPPRQLPPLIFLCSAVEAGRSEAHLRDTRVVGLLPTPLTLAQILGKAQRHLPVRPEMADALPG